MKTKITLLITILTISCTAFAQNYTYTYDAAGNRIARVVVLPPSKSTLQNNGSTNQQTEEEIAEEKTLKDKLGSFDLLVYPNPTKGLVIVKISGKETIESATYNVYDTGGKQVASGTVASSMLLIDLSQQIAGTYNLIVNINCKQQSWKIIKE